jgi:hypothetical protein
VDTLSAAAAAAAESRARRKHAVSHAGAWADVTPTKLSALVRLGDPVALAVALDAVPTGANTAISSSAH